jgi:hypothetical protein
MCARSTRPGLLQLALVPAVVHHEAAPAGSFCEDSGFATVFRDDFDGAALNTSAWTATVAPAQVQYDGAGLSLCLTLL